ncbi:MAG: thiamine-phosphate kinase [Opitutales bacterium]
MHPFSHSPESCLSSLGEVRLIERIREWLGDTAPPSPYGMGDDTAVLPHARHNLLTTDSLVYGRHFDDTLPPGLAGAKLLKRNLSDIAAMGGTPGVAVLAGFLPGHTTLAWLEAFTRGLADCARTWSVPVVGGDLSATDSFLGFNLTLTGQATRPILRGAARPGDLIWVSGELGGSLAGHHATFTPRLPEGQWLGAQADVHTLIDVTDGLAKDLPTLLPAGTAAALQLETLPLAPAAHDAARGSEREAWTHALSDGEDYELAFTTAPDWAENGAPAWSRHFKTRLTCIGKVVTTENEVARALLDAATGRPLPLAAGYEHFR